MTRRSKQLDYGRPMAWHGRRRTQQAVLLFASLIVVTCLWFGGPVAWQHFEQIWSRWELIGWQNKCLAYAAPLHQIVYDDDPAAAERLLALDPQYRLFRWHPPFVAYCPAVLRRFSATVADSGIGPVFMHERCSPAGHRRLVLVQLIPSAAIACQCTVVSPAILAHEGCRVGENTVILFRMRRPDERWRFYAGQPDTADSSHFSIGYEVDHLKGSIDGWLQDNETILLQFGHSQTAVGDGMSCERCTDDHQGGRIWRRFAYQNASKKETVRCPRLSIESGSASGGLRCS